MATMAMADWMTFLCWFEPWRPDLHSTNIITCIRLEDFHQQRAILWCYPSYWRAITAVLMCFFKNRVPKAEKKSKFDTSRKPKKSKSILLYANLHYRRWSLGWPSVYHTFHHTRHVTNIPLRSTHAEWRDILPQ